MSLQDAYKQMIKSVKGSWEGMSRDLGITVDALRNRVYNVKTQVVPVEMALEMQTISGLTSFAEEIARQSGGVFVKLPEVGEVDNEDLLRKFNTLYADVGELSREFTEATKNDDVNPGEKAVLEAIGQKITRHTHELLALTFQIYCRK